MLAFREVPAASTTDSSSCTESAISSPVLSESAMCLVRRTQSSLSLSKLGPVSTVTPSCRCRAAINVNRYSILSCKSLAKVLPGGRTLGPCPYEQVSRIIATKCAENLLPVKRELIRENGRVPAHVYPIKSETRHIPSKCCQTCILGSVRPR